MCLDKFSVFPKIESEEEYLDEDEEYEEDEDPDYEPQQGQAPAECKQQ